MLTITSGFHKFTKFNLSTCGLHVCLCRSLENSLKAWRQKMLLCFPSLPVVPFWVFISFSRWVYMHLYQEKLKKHLWSGKGGYYQDSIIGNAYVWACLWKTHVNFSKGKQTSVFTCMVLSLFPDVWFEKKGKTSNTHICDLVQVIEIHVHAINICNPCCCRKRMMV